jgi:hypothetical protein
MADDPEDPSTRIPWPVRSWPLAIVGVAVTAALVLLAIFVDSDVTRVALPGIAGAIGTIGLAMVTVRLSVQERIHQDRLRRTDELIRRQEAERQQEIKEAEERAASEREKQLELATAVRQARRVAGFGGWEGSPVHGLSTVTLVNGSDYPIFDIALIGGRVEELGGVASDREWPPEMRLEGESCHVAVLLPGERHVFRGKWKWRKGFVLAGNTLKQQRASYSWIVHVRSTRGERGRSPRSGTVQWS